MRRLFFLTPLLLAVLAGWAYVRLAGNPLADLSPLTTLAACTKQSPFAARVACYRPILEPHLDARGPRAVLADLDSLQSAQPVFAAHCHDMAHVLGRYWIATGKAVAEGFREGSNVCHSGFYHGMVERIIRGDQLATGADIEHIAPDELRRTVPTICTSETLGTESGNFRFQCLHGLGHAVVFSVGHNLPLALELCDTIPDAWGRRSCHGGAFMENITGVERERRMVRSGDPHYPCSIVGTQYRAACYGMQTSWMLEDGVRLDMIPTLCREAGDARLSCFQSLGRDYSPRARQEGSKVYADLCAGFADDEREACIKGAIYALADHTWDGRYAYPFCAALDDPAVRSQCFSLAHGHLRGSLEQPREKLASNCRQYVPDISECRAQLPAVSPSG